MYETPRGRRALRQSIERAIEIVLRFVSELEEIAKKVVSLFRSEATKHIERFTRPSVRNAG